MLGRQELRSSMPVLYASVPWHFRIDPGILRSFVSGLL